MFSLTLHFSIHHLTKGVTFLNWIQDWNDYLICHRLIWEINMEMWTLTYWLDLIVACCLTGRPQMQLSLVSQWHVFIAWLFNQKSWGMDFYHTLPKLFFNVRYLLYMLIFKHIITWKLDRNDTALYNFWTTDIYYIFST